MQLIHLVLNNTTSFLWGEATMSELECYTAPTSKDQKLKSERCGYMAVCNTIHDAIQYLSSAFGMILRAAGISC